MEYCNEGTLEELSRTGLTESLIRRYTKELVIAIEYLHGRNIIHRDIKGEGRSQASLIISLHAKQLCSYPCCHAMRGCSSLRMEIDYNKVEITPNDML